MDSGQKALIQASFRRVLTVADLAAELFAGRLYLLDPTLWHDLDLGARAGQRALFGTLARSVEDLDRFDQLAASLESVARRCASEGIGEIEIGTMAETLLWTLQQVLGDAYNARTAAAWCAVSALLVGCMKRAAAAQAISPATLRRIRRSSCPELWQAPFRPIAVFPSSRPAARPEVHDDADLDVGRLAELPPPPVSARVPASVRMSALPLSSRLTPVS